MRTTKAVVEENVLEGTTPLKWICACMVGAYGLALFRRLKGRKFGDAAGRFR